MDSATQKYFANILLAVATLGSGTYVADKAINKFEPAVETVPTSITIEDIKKLMGEVRCNCSDPKPGVKPENHWVPKEPTGSKIGAKDE